MLLVCCKGFLCLLWGIVCGLSGWGSLPLYKLYASCFILVLLQVWFDWPLSIVAMDPNSLGEALSPHNWATDVVFSVTALLSQWRVLDGVCPSSALAMLWCRVGLLVMMCGWFLMIAWYRDPFGWGSLSNCLVPMHVIVLVQLFCFVDTRIWLQLLSLWLLPIWCVGRNL
jgi:hypothetical protein